MFLPIKLNIIFLNIFILLFLPCTIYAETIYDSDPYLPKTKGTIKAGYGYILKTNRISSLPCYDVKLSYSNLEGAIKFDSSMSSRELENMFQFDTSANLKIGFFSADAEAKYLKDIEESDTSFSLNYGQYTVGDANIELTGGGTAALNEYGKNTYKNGKNPKFINVCGDHIFTNFKQGAVLILSVLIQFADNSQKRTFQTHMGADLGNIFTVASNIKKIAGQSSMNPKVKILAYQKGGDPVQLVKILNKDASGHYYSATCSSGDMNDCINIADGLLNYAVNDFPNQYSFSEQKGLESFGLGFAEYLPIEYIGLLMDSGDSSEL
jgi:hypothetical protein